METSSQAPLWFQELVAERFRVVDERHALLMSELALLKSRLDALTSPPPVGDAQNGGSGAPPPRQAAKQPTWRMVTRGA